MMFLLPVSLFSSSFDLIRHVPSFSLVGPYSTVQYSKISHYRNKTENDVGAV
jgi:hypothetical protein